jgi:hypothetical protein
MGQYWFPVNWKRFESFEHDQDRRCSLTRHS